MSCTTMSYSSTFVLKSNTMKKNIGAFDGVIRIILAIVIIFYAGLKGPWWLGFIALIPTVSAGMFYCPLYDMMGMNTCDPGEQNTEQH